MKEFTCNRAAITNTDSSTHENYLLHAVEEFRVYRNKESNIGHWTAGYDGNLLSEFVHYELHRGRHTIDCLYWGDNGPDNIGICIRQTSDAPQTIDTVNFRVMFGRPDQRLCGTHVDFLIFVCAEGVETTGSILCGAD